MKISLIIAYYKDTRALDLIFTALTHQTHRDFEVIVAEDDNDLATRSFIAEAMKTSSFPIKHVHQDEDKGFRKTVVLNKAIKVSDGEFLVFMDGDCIPHRRLLSSYARFAAEDTALFGRRVMLSEKLTRKLYDEKDLNLLSCWSIWTSQSEDKKYSLYLPFFKKQYKLGVFGCNWGIFKNKIIEVNGYDEDYVTVGVGEDNDIEWRLVANGMRIRSLRYSAILYHLYHKPNYAIRDCDPSYAMLKKKLAMNELFCRNGLVKR